VQGELVPISSEPTPLEIETQIAGDRTLVVLSGELDAATASYLYSIFAELEVKATSNVVLDLALLKFMDSTGLSVIITEHKRLQHAGGRLTIYSPTSSVRRLFEITGLSDVIDIVPLEG
jgi:anti-sigma B factor antagonist